MKLFRLLEKLDYTLVRGELDTNISVIAQNSAKVEKGCVFVCIHGKKVDGHNYIAQAIKNGAKAIVVEKEVDIQDDVTVIRVADTREALSYMAASYYDYPAEKLCTIGITGTKGKTTTAYMIRSILEHGGYKTGMIGTIEILVGKKRIDTHNTTPDALLIQQYLSEMIDDGCRVAIMEVSSQGLMLNRVAGIIFDYGIFTNISPDHIGPNEHSSYEEYRECKSKLFRQCKTGIVNMDCKELKYILRNHTCKVETYSIQRKSQLCGYRPSLLKKQGAMGIRFYTRGRMNEVFKLWMPGIFNIYNCLAAMMLAKDFQIPHYVIKEALEKVQIKGRLELVPVKKNYTVMIDYAHNAKSLLAVLTMLKDYHPVRVVCMFGCGGNRSKARRFEMGEVSGRNADLTVITSDNPRRESPETIISDIILGVRRTQGQFVTIADRREAIRYCLEQAQDGDILLFAGKGHETYQEINDIYYEMDERKIIEEILNEEKGL